MGWNGSDGELFNSVKEVYFFQKVSYLLAERDERTGLRGCGCQTTEDKMVFCFIKKA